VHLQISVIQQSFSSNFRDRLWVGLGLRIGIWLGQHFQTGMMFNDLTRQNHSDPICKIALCHFVHFTWKKIYIYVTALVCCKISSLLIGKKKYIFEMKKGQLLPCILLQCMLLNNTISYIILMNPFYLWPSFSILYIFHNVWLH